MNSKQLQALVLQSLECVRPPGCQIVHENGVALVRAMQLAVAAGDPAAAKAAEGERVLQSSRTGAQ